MSAQAQEITTVTTGIGYADATSFHGLSTASVGTILPTLAIVAALQLLMRKIGRSTTRQHTVSKTSQAPTEEETALGIDGVANASLEVLPLRYCPVCASAYVPETEICEECGVELQSEPEEDDSRTTSYGNDTTIRVARISDPLKCSLVLGLLRNQGIPCTLSQATVLGHHGGDIHVLLRDAYHAKVLIREYLSELEQESVAP
jgi:hypothetical protein